MKYLENIKAQMRKGSLEYAVLLIIAKKKAYSSDILKKLQASKLIVVEGTLYPILSRLRKSELVQYDWKESASGPPRKYYSLTASGQTALKDLKTSWDSLSSSLNSLSNNNEKNN